MLLNIIQCVVLGLFIATSIYVVLQERKNIYGIIIKEGNKSLTNGKQGVQFTFGRMQGNDIVIKNPIASRIQSCFTYTGNEIQIQDFHGKSCEGYNYSLAGHDYSFEKSERVFMIHHRCLPLITCLLFIIVRFFSLFFDYRTPMLITPFIIIALYPLVSQLFDKHSSTIIESSFSVFLSFYIFSNVYKSTEDSMRANIIKSILGVLLYVVFAILAKIVISFVDFSRISKLQLKNLNILKKTRLSAHDIIRFVALVILLALMVFNLVFAKEVNGARNWVYVGSLSIQPSEVIKVLLLFIIVMPIGQNYFDYNNIVYLIVVPGLCFFYCMLIKDIGAMIEMVAIWVLIIVIQVPNIFVISLILSGMLLGEKIILRVSSTAVARMNVWNSDDIWSSLASKGAFEDMYDKGYQSSHSLIAAIASGKLFGNPFYDVDIMKNITASDSDLIIATICQKYGCVMCFLLLITMIIVIVATIVNTGKQTKVQQSLAMLSLALIVVAWILNVGGTFSIIPLTGVVLPCFSKGVSSSISYGIAFGFLTCKYKNINQIINAYPIKNYNKIKKPNWRRLYEKYKNGRINIS